MSINLSIKEVPEALADRLRLRAALNHRSLQGELMAIIERAANEFADAGSPSAGVPAASRERQLRGWKTVEDLVAERRAVGWQLASPPGIPLAVDIIRADRDAR
jgi:plasmid stability protein